MDKGRNQSPPDPEFAICDATFCAQVERLRQLHDFVFKEAIPVNASDIPTLAIGDLRSFHFHQEGRMPTPSEWNKIDERILTMSLFLTPALRRRFLMGGTPWMVTWLPLYFLGLGAFSLIFALITVGAIGWPPAILFVVYSIWLASLGAMGALASIGMNALSLQDDITFDITNARLMSLRVVLGVLFGVVISLPFGYPNFQKFCLAVWNPEQFYVGDADILAKQAISLLLPFILGFSTSLVIQLLSQVIDAAQALLGRRPSASNPTFPASR